MSVPSRLGRRAGLLLVLAVALAASGCFLDRSYRPADLKTVRDFPAHGRYRKQVGVMALTNTTLFTNPQVGSPFTTAFLAGLEAEAGSAALFVPGEPGVPAFLGDPPRLPNGDLDVYTLSTLARQQGLNVVATPILMDIRVRQEHTGFWLFKEIAHFLQIQTAAALYDTITGARLSLKLLTDEVDIDEDEAQAFRSGREVPVEALVAVAETMGAKLGKTMGTAVGEALWQSTVTAVQGQTVVIPAGSDVGIAAGDRLAVLRADRVITGLAGQRYVVPGPKIGEIEIERVTADNASGMPVSGDPPPVGSIVVAGE